MNPGDLVLIRLPQLGSGAIKLRPALCLALLPGKYQNVLICGVSTKTADLEPDWDELLDPSDPDYASSGVQRLSAIRLSYLYAADSSEIVRAIGRISRDRLRRLLGRLAARLTATT